MLRKFPAEKFCEFLAEFRLRFSGNFRSMASCIFRTKSTKSGRQGRPWIGAKTAMRAALMLAQKFAMKTPLRWDEKFGIAATRDLKLSDV